MKKKPSLAGLHFKPITPAKLEKAGVVTHFSDNAFGDCSDFGEPNIIILGETPVGWFQINPDDEIVVIEVLPEFQKRGIATQTLKLVYGGKPPETALTATPASPSGTRLLAKFGYTPNETYED